MQQDVQNAKQLIVERVRQSTNILVAVSANPSVDSLASALGLALILNKLDKHATAVFSGTIPPAMTFLNPGKTFENSVDSLRDFIISLDKEKADRLRYKVEDDVVRIFITPYRSTISEKDLQFSQGDFNVELILCLGVEKREDLDKAIIAHGRILHDATVMTINANSQQSSLGMVDWHEPNASSLSEMLVSLSEAFQQPGLLDAQIATALLTGIVAATDRFSNERTNPRVMTMSAQLMAAGANQQLIANNLTAALPQQPPQNGQLDNGAASVKIAEAPPEKPKEKGELDIVHPKKGGKDKQQSQEDALAAALPSAAAAVESFDELKSAIEKETPPPPPPPKSQLPPQKFLKEPKKTPGGEPVSPAPEETPAPAEENYVAQSGSWRGRRLEAPSMGGTLNATTEEAMDEARKAEEEERNHKILSHDSLQTKKMVVQPPAEPAPEPAPEPPAMPPAPEPEASAEPPLPPPAPVPEPTMPIAPVPEPAPEPTPAPVPEPEPAPLPPPSAPEPTPEPVTPPPLPEPPAPQPAEPLGADLDAARQAVTDALSSQPFDPAGQPLQSAGAMPLGVPTEPPAVPAEPAPLPPPPVAPIEPPSMTTTPLPPPPPLPEPPTAEPPAMPADGGALPPLPPMPPLPEQQPGQPLPPPPSLNDLPPLPGNIPPAPITPPVDVPPELPPAPPADPGQFQIPGAPPSQQ